MRPIIYTFSFLLIFVLSHVVAQTSIQADEEFHWGVQSYHAGHFNESILSFSRVLSLNPNHPNAREWLAESYYASGFLEAALDEWKIILQQQQSSHISDRIRSTELRYFNRPTVPETYVEVHSYSMNQSLGYQAINVQKRSEGGFYLLSINQNEILHLSSTGILIERIRGGLGNFASPFDLVEHGDFLYVSELKGNRIAILDKNNKIVKRFGTKGIGDGQFLGPQYLAIDAEGFLYVSDWGNRRISKFDADGQFLLHVPTVKRPTGIAIIHDKLYVADAEMQGILVFDTNANYLRSFDLVLHDPASIRKFDDQRLLISDGDRILIYNINTETIEHSIASSTAKQWFSAARDNNGSIIVVDVHESLLHFYVSSFTSYSGLNVRIERIRSSEFPRVVIDLRVADKMGKPISGLLASDFIVSEYNTVVSPIRIIRDAERDPNVSVTLLFEHSPAADDLQSTLEDALRDLLSDSSNISLQAIAAEENPVMIEQVSSTDSLLDALADAYYSNAWQFDQALRYTTSTLVEGKPRRSIIFFSSGRLPDSAFSHYTPEILAHYMMVNNISFSVVYLRKLPEQDPFLEYLVEKSGGHSSYAYQDGGLDMVFDRLRKQSNGAYAIEYISKRDGDFGRAFFPQTVEAQFFIRSGRAVSGFFSPPEF